MSSVKLITSQLLNSVVRHIEESDSIYLLISFVMQSGVRLLAPYLRAAANRGADIKILTGDYLFVTEPNALRELYEIDHDIEIRLWSSQGISFHPKAYIFRKSTAEDVVIVGSSNASRSALTTGVEWNLSVATRVEEDLSEKAIEDAEIQFFSMFYSDRTLPVNAVSIEDYENRYQEYHRLNPNLAKTWSETEALEWMFDESPTESQVEIHEETSSYRTPITLRPAQIEALEQLDITKSEDYTKALVVMATGLGKTFLAAVFAKDYERVLFIAHREEILRQSLQAFRRVSPDKSMGLYTGFQKDAAADVLFASIMTLGQKRHRTRFPRNYFNLIIVDEFHHAAADTYRAVLDWFAPDFLLGLTATPDRADGREVYALCDRNVAYRMEFLEAIQRGWLAPFHYIGVYDDTDYSQIRWLGTRYDEQQLLAVQLRDSMAQQVFQAWQEHAQTRSLGFCSSVTQASFLSNFFQHRGVRSISLHAGSPRSQRIESIKQISSGELDIIFTVDLFNEGVDIPAVDTLLFVRPTESLTVFTQQVGRGLRQYEGKSFCTIIDLIGNYRNADIKLALFDTQAQVEGARSTRTLRVEPKVPEGCDFHLDVRIIDLVQAMKRKNHPRKDRLREAYFALKLDLGHRPSYEEMHLLARVDSREIKQEYGSFVNFLAALGELTAGERKAHRTTEKWFLELESTRMTMAYKMVMLLAMLERGPFEWYKPMTAGEIAPFFRNYYLAKEYRREVDFPKTRKTFDLDTATDIQTARLIERNPMTQWAKSTNDIAQFNGNSFWFELDIEQGTEQAVYDRTREACSYRLHQYFERKG